VIFTCPGCGKSVELRELEEEIDVYDGYSEVTRVFRCPECGFRLVRRVRWHRKESHRGVPWRCQVARVW
jgi:predicted RNA-binding Zn-ribbon protein involved in translation (DUF1610 family)